MSYSPLLISIDTETGGTNPNKHSLLQVGMIAYEDGIQVDSLEFTIRRNDYVVAPMALQVNQLDLSKVFVNGKTTGQAVLLIQDFVERNFPKSAGYFKRPMMLGHNVGFDRGFLKVLFESVGAELDDSFDYHSIDTSSLIQAAKLSGKLDKDAPNSLQKIAKYLGIQPDIQHKALADADTTIKVYEKLIWILKQPAQYIPNAELVVEGEF